MISLPNITLVAMTGKDRKGHIEALNKSAQGIKWGKILLLTPETDTELSVMWNKGEVDKTITIRKINPIESIDEWNYKIIYELPSYIHTDFALLVHADGYVVNGDLWKTEFLDYDYVGAPWPLPTDSYSYRDAHGSVVRVGNSVSLRSKKLMDLAAQTSKEYFWSMKEKYGNTNEDGFICCHNRNWLEEQGCKFAPLEIAKHFSKEHEIPENVGLETFAFHTVDK